jgi:hypothetical protein
LSRLEKIKVEISEEKDVSNILTSFLCGNVTCEKLLGMLGENISEDVYSQPSIFQILLQNRSKATNNHHRKISE